MHVRRFDDPVKFMQVCGTFLAENEAENGLILGVVEGFIAGGTAPLGLFLAAIEDERDRVVAAAMITPPHDLVLTRAPQEAIVALAEALAKAQQSVPGVLGTKTEAAFFAETWSHARGVRATRWRSERIYTLSKVIPPPWPIGVLAKAESKHRELVVQWGARSAADTGNPGETEGFRSAINEGRLFLWATDEPVSMAFWTAPTPRGVRISGVYTPPAHRRHSYASALVASVSERMLASGKEFCFLYTDLANPISNSIYVRVGYRAVADCAHYSFGAR
jgi:uncharacterized protein